MKPEERLAAALDAVPGATDLADDTPDVRQEVKDAIMDVMLGTEGPDGLRRNDGINAHLRFSIMVSKQDLVRWQNLLNKALEKL